MNETDTQLGEVLSLAAYERFDACGAASDFGVQCVQDTTAVFGGTNRVIWSVEGRFRPDRSYCTERFLTAWDAKYGPILVSAFERALSALNEDVQARLTSLSDAGDTEGLNDLAKSLPNDYLRFVGGKRPAFRAIQEMETE